MIHAAVVLRCDAAIALPTQERLVRCERTLTCDRGVTRTRRWATRHGWIEWTSGTERMHLCPSHARRADHVTLWVPTTRPRPAVTL